jgi:hypothetical protein
MVATAGIMVIDRIMAATDTAIIIILGPTMDVPCTGRVGTEGMVGMALGLASRDLVLAFTSQQPRRALYEGKLVIPETTGVGRRRRAEPRTR